MTLREWLWGLLAFGVLPAWLAAGGADWWCHRRSRIEHTSGAKESRLHLLLFVQVAAPASIALWFEVSAGLFALMATCVIAHMLTSWWDTSYAQPKRHIAPIEQQIHSWLEMLPLFALLIVGVLQVDELRERHWSINWRAEPLPAPWVAGTLLAFAAGAALIIEEWWRSARAAARSTALRHSS
jgi:hypothetical protein